MSTTKPLPLPPRKLIYTSTSRVQDHLMERYTKLRKALWAFGSEIAIYYGGMGARMWEELGLEGLAATCYCIGQEMRETWGGGALAAEASALACMMMREANE